MSIRQIQLASYSLEENKVHIPATLLIDLQALYRPSLTPDFIRALPQLYVQMSNDPLVGGALDLLGDSKHFIWFKTFLALEA